MRWWPDFRVREIRCLYRDVMETWMWFDTIEFCPMVPIKFVTYTVTL